MRTIGQFDQPEPAQRFGDFLYLQGIENEVEEEDDGGFSVWVLEDAQLPQAAALLERFRAAPDAKEFKKVDAAAARQRELAARDESSRRSTVVDAERVAYERIHGPYPLVPIILIVLASVATLYSDFGQNARISGPLFISLYRGPIIPLEAASGQLWRLVTPIFMHLGWLHLIFNMLWLFELGKLLQQHFSPGYLLGLVAAAAVLSNLGQYWWAGPAFGGMSGVNYALFGFLWMRAKFDPRATWELNPTTIQMMLGWFVICLTGLLGPVANGAHFVGLAVGAAWGWASSGRLRFSR